VRILLSYSYQHFDPGRPQESDPMFGTSANILARAFHTILSELGDLTYIDGSQARISSVAGQHFDLFVGIDSGFSEVLERCDVDRSVYVAVNMHPVAKNDIISGFARRAKLPRQAFTADDTVDERRMQASIDAADCILCVGNVATLNTYVRHRVPRDRIRLISFGAEDATPAQRRSSIPTYAYIAAQAGLRKGFDFVYNMLVSPDIVNRPFRVHIVGGVANDFYRRKLDDLKATLGDRMIVRGWLNASSPEYRGVLDECDFLLCPSLEEGTPGTVIEAVARGVVPIVSRNAGLDFSPLGYFELEPNSERNVEILRSSMDLGAEERAALSQRSHEYYQQFHASYRQQIAELLTRIVASESLYPKVSVVLPIGSEDAVAPRALDLLHAACEDYPSAELHVVFDNCGERTEAAVRHFFASSEPSYDVIFETAPGLSEVKTSNLALKGATGRYCALVRPDSHIHQRDAFAEAVTFLERAPRCAILGGLAGMNFYPRATRGLSDVGSLVVTDQEVYERLDANADPRLENRFFEVDAAIRGPLFIRKSFLEEHGYLDETYAPFYADDWDISYRARDRGLNVYAVPMGVENVPGEGGDATPERREVVYRNGALFYSRWTFSTEKDYLWLHRTRLYGARSRPKLRVFAAKTRSLRRSFQHGSGVSRRRAVLFLRGTVNGALAPLGLELRRRRTPGRWRPARDGEPRDAWLDALEIGTVLDIGANEGQSALEFASRLPGIRIISFEPLTDCFAKLSSLRDVLPDFEAHNIALSDVSGAAPIHRSSFSPSSSLLPMGDLHKQSFPWTADTTVEHVRTERLDDLELDARGNLLVKLDVQGFEDRVIAGGRQTIGSARAVIIEVTFKPGLYDGQASFQNVYRALTALGFEYAGNLWTVMDPTDGAPLQGDALFTRIAS